MKILIGFIGIRIADLSLTFLALKDLPNFSAEGNPISQFLLENYGWINFIVLNLIISLGFFYLLNKFKMGKSVIKLFIPLNSLIVGVNIYSLFI